MTLLNALSPLAPSTLHLLKGSDQPNKSRFELDTQLDDNWSSLISITQLFCPEMTAMLENYKQDRVSGKQVFLGMRRASAASGYHHDYEGGLVLHYLQMIELAGKLISSTEEFQLLSDCDVVRAVILHDLHKGWKTYVKDPETGKIFYGDHCTDLLLKNNHKSLMMYLPYCSAQRLGTSGANDAQACLSLELINALFGSEGGYAKDAPKENTLLSKFVYCLDELSVLMDRVHQGRLVSNRDRDRSFFDLD